MGKDVRNRIITISGEPVSGKGANINAIIQKLKQDGILEENIHLIQTGEKFRTYFNNIIDFIANINNEETLKSLAESQELKTILQNPEYKNILIDTIVKIKKKGISLDDFSIGEANKSEDFAELRKVVDYLIDKGIEDLGKEINKQEHPEEVWIIDSRLAFHNIPESFSVRLTANADVAAKRLFNDKSRGKEDNQYATIEQAKEARENRRIGERERYLSRYGVDLEDENNYDLVIDTSYSTIKDISDTILDCQYCSQQGIPFSKKWASQKIFLPLQSEIQTYARKTPKADSMEQLAEKIEKNGYIPSEAIEVVNVDGYLYIIEGHHRNFASVYANKSLIPYQIIAENDEEIPGYGSNTARQRAERLSHSNLMGHEYILEQGLKKNNPEAIFHYEDIFPELCQRLKSERDSGIIEL